MKRALAIGAILCAFGMTGFAQLTAVTGSWTTNLNIIPTWGLVDTTLTLKTTISYFTITSTTVFGAVTTVTYTDRLAGPFDTYGAPYVPGPVIYDDWFTRTAVTAVGYQSQSFSMTATFGPFTLTGAMSFAPNDRFLKEKYYIDKNATLLNPLALPAGTTYLLVDDVWFVPGPSYISSSLTATFAFGGITLRLAFSHTAENRTTFSGWGTLCANDWQIGPGIPGVTPGAVVNNPWSTFFADMFDCWDKAFLVSKNTEIRVNTLYVIWMDATNAVVGTPAAITGVATALGYDLISPYTVDTNDPAPLVQTVGNYRYYWIDAIANPGYLTANAYNAVMAHVAGLTPPATATQWAVYARHDAGMFFDFWLANHMTYTWTFTLSPVTATVRFDDFSTGIQFRTATLSLTGLEICCGVKYDLAIGFNKCRGFEYISFTVRNFAQICCDISFDLSITYGVDYKMVSVTPKFGGFADVCFTVFADLLYSGGRRGYCPPHLGADATVGDLFLDAIRVDGFAIRCTLADCNYVEWFTALSPQWFRTSALRPHTTRTYHPTGVFPAGTIAYFTGTEFEVIELGFCGAGCCGGQYTVKMMIFFGDRPGTLFAMTRLAMNYSLPIMANFSIIGTFNHSLLTNVTTMTLGWTFTF